MAEAASAGDRRVIYHYEYRRSPDQDARATAPAIVGALLEGLIGPLASPGSNMREAVQTVTLLSLRAVGVVDARARGLVAQCPLPQNPNATSAPAPSSIQAARA